MIGARKAFQPPQIGHAENESTSVRRDVSVLKAGTGLSSPAACHLRVTPNVQGGQSFRGHA